ncbi:MAG: phosphate ABC transporter permease PstA [Acholeplasmataceae bacterium]
MRHKYRKVIDTLSKTVTYLASLISVLILGAILFFIFDRGLQLLNWDIITGDNATVISTLKSLDNVDYSTYSFTSPELQDGQYFSQRLGIVLEDTKSLEGKKLIKIAYVDDDSPLKQLIDSSSGDIRPIVAGDLINSAGFIYDIDGNRVAYYPSDGAQTVSQTFDMAVSFSTLPISTAGGGIRGSIIVTLYIVALTLVIAMPIGVVTSLYMHEIAPQNKIVDIMRSLIDMLTGIPSIVYGLMGAAFFVPLVINMFGSDVVTGGSLISGALTMSVIVLPVIIKATDTALDVVPKEYKEASLALGANKTQTTFKIMLPNATPGILSAALLAIGRVIGESAALIFAIGVVVKDQVSLTSNGTTLAVHIWSAMAAEIPNVALSSTIAIIILAVVLMLNMIVKLLTFRFMKRFNK